MMRSPMPVLVVGSVALDSVETPAGSRREQLGGSASYFSLAASVYGPVRMVGVVGTDFPDAHMSLLRRSGLDLGGLKVEEGKTFRWEGVYAKDMNERTSLRTDLNVFLNFHPDLPPAYLDTPCVFLANIDPVLQMEVLDQLDNPVLVCLDTMNYWITSKREQLLAALRRVQVILLNDTEAMLLTGADNVLKAAEGIRMMGPSVVVVKRGEFGALARTEQGWFSVPAVPLEAPQDPTGAGDAFAGGLIGFLARGGGELEESRLRLGLAHGAAVASFAVERFSVTGLVDLTSARINQRVRHLWEVSHFDLTPSAFESL
jgi:sugar/nucleoside kinase (ribokinase family)